MDPINDLPQDMDDATAQAGHLASDLQSRAKDAWHTVQDQGGRAVEKGTAYARENPLPTALIGFGAGLLIGLALGHSSEPTLQERYVEKPYHQSRGAILGLLLAAAAFLRRGLATTSEAACDLGSDLQDSLEPLQKAAGRARKKVGL